MKSFRVSFVAFVILLLAPSVFSQRAEITISFNEQFFESLLDALFQYAPPPEISLASNTPPRPSGRTSISNSFVDSSGSCNEVIKLMRENNGVRTAVKFRQGQIHAPIAFSGNYSPPLIGCVPFAGVADAIIDLTFDEQGQRLIARARVQDVALNGTGGVGGGLVARMVQGSIDRKINPIEIVNTEKLSFLLPLQDANIRMRAIGISHDVSGGQLNVRVAYQFEKAK